MSEFNDGGHAFPQREQVGDVSVAQGGMTLRDYFAAKALPSVYDEYVIIGLEHGFDEGWKMAVAIDAYEVADAMLRAREHKK